MTSGDGRKAFPGIKVLKAKQKCKGVKSKAVHHRESRKHRMAVSSLQTENQSRSKGTWREKKKNSSKDQVEDNCGVDYSKENRTRVERPSLGGNHNHRLGGGQQGGGVGVNKVSVTEDPRKQRMFRRRRGPDRGN